MIQEHNIDKPQLWQNISSYHSRRYQDELSHLERIYDESYLSFSFTVLTAGGVEKPQCVLCSEVLAASLLKPSRLKRHLEMKHPRAVNKDAEVFRHQADRLVKSKLDDTEMQDVAACLKASYEVSKKIAAKKKPHNIGEQLVLPYCKDIISLVLRMSELQKLRHVSLPNNTVSRRIAEMSDNILSQVISKIKTSMFNYAAIQIDKTTDMADLAQLCGYVHYVYNKCLEYEFLFFQKPQHLNYCKQYIPESGSIL
ncbi:zinc finger BED domain-containing protein 5-like [Octopus bimaculoides]|uniref:zinc finger BED domain-containing protein 5-like n=1 Tax=Octopus bimaculoides TaxID=37653 RepID=UPI00071E534D|nr:zinc finger BED domain-containing protein 5-like [Octopus bimaculoides]|eukprot:XP_014780158.1 PREDICTED: zinc finger BED domain-containing protein 5-like [Octopus bimaculoides]